MGVFLPEIELPLDYRDRDFFGGVFEENLLLRHKKNHRAPVKAFSVAFSASMRLARLAPSRCYRIQWSDMAYLTESIVVDKMYVSPKG